MRKWITTLHRGIVGAALTCAGLAALALGALSLYRESTGSAVAGLGAGLVLLFAATIDRFESIKGLGMEAKTRKLDETIDKAEVALTQLRDLTQLSGALLVKLHSGIGRLDSAPSVMENYEVAMQVKKQLQAIGTQDQKIRLALDPWIRVAALDSYYSTFEKLRAALEQTAGDMKNRRQIEVGANITSLDARLDAIHRHLERADDYVLTGDSHHVVRCFEKLVSEAPELTDEVRSDLDQEVLKALSEIRYIMTNLDFGDRNYWRCISIRPPLVWSEVQ